MIPQYSYRKDRLPKGFSFPIKRGELDSALERCKVEGLFYVYFLHGSGKAIFEAQDHGELRAKPVFDGGEQAAGRSSLSFYAVPSTQRAIAHDPIINHGFPVLCRWLEMVRNSGNVWRATDHRLVFSLENETLSYLEC